MAFAREVVGSNVPLPPILEVTLGGHSSGSLTIPRCKIGTLRIHYTQARVELRQWCIHPGFKTHGQSQPKSKTQNTSGFTKW